MLQAELTKVTHGGLYVKRLPPWHQRTDERDETLVFESRFESANLKRAVQVDRGSSRLVAFTSWKRRNQFFLACWTGGSVRVQLDAAARPRFEQAHAGRLLDLDGRCSGPHRKHK